MSLSEIIFIASFVFFSFYLKGQEKVTSHDFINYIHFDDEENLKIHDYSDKFSAIDQFIEHIYTDKHGVTWFVTNNGKYVKNLYVIKHNELVEIIDAVVIDYTNELDSIWFVNETNYFLWEMIFDTKIILCLSKRTYACR